MLKGTTNILSAIFILLIKMCIYIIIQTFYKYNKISNQHNILQDKPNRINIHIC